MRKLLLAGAVAGLFIGAGFSQPNPEHPHSKGGSKAQQPQMQGMGSMHGGMGMQMGMGMDMSMMPMMKMMMQDPELRKIIMEHRRQCRQELMRKLASNPKAVEKMLMMMAHNEEAVKKVLKKNPTLKKKLEGLLK